ncbi:hypothetical protein [uncultured Oscillibacter sp.]|uniref:hypothetical protein n=1 Tax=uncultured Oscillibacter sp. TaxID=876091 RepID=UPI0026286FDF|nr:hypothetical protein [uncultured Oscillibacter sp.]
MTGTLYTADHRMFRLPPLLSWRVTHTGTVPCDSFSATFVYQKEMAEVLPLAAGFAAEAEGETVLRAIVDEYTVDLDANGLTATISGRGYAARLLDNESRPVTYQQATLAEILANHVQPYGITCRDVAAVRAESVYTVAAGTSQWRAVEGFCRAYGGFVPRFSREGELLAGPEPEGRTLSIGEGGPVLACTLREDHYGVLTEALVIDKTRNQDFSVKNQEMIRKGGQCRRVVYTPGQSTWAAMRYTGEYQIQRSQEDAWTAEVTLPGSFLAFPGDRAALSLERMGLSGTFRVAEAENRFDHRNGASVTLTLKPLA